MLLPALGRLAYKENPVERTKHAPGQRVYHLRRRLSAAEEKIVGPVVDIRGTYEATRRVKLVATALKVPVSEIYRIEPVLRRG